MTGIKVTPEQLQCLASRIGSGAAQVESEQRAMAAALSPLGTDWAGTASGRFSALWAEWQRSAASLNQALTGISSLLGQAGGAYAEAERQITASFGRG